jgi:hypothetical protein
MGAIARAIEMVTMKDDATRRRRANSGASVIDGKEPTAHCSAVPLSGLLEHIHSLTSKHFFHFPQPKIDIL